MPCPSLGAPLPSWRTGARTGHAGMSSPRKPPMSGCPWPESHCSRPPSDGVADLLPRSPGLPPGAPLSCEGAFVGLTQAWGLPLSSQVLTDMNRSFGGNCGTAGGSLYRAEAFRSYRFSPGLYFFALTMPVSTTYFIPVMVMEVSAMLVAMITLRQP